MSTNIKILQDLDNNTFYPKTHTQAIIDNNGTTLEDRLEGIEGNILPSGGTNGLILEKDNTLSTGAKWTDRTHIAVGTTTTGEPGTDANVTNSGTATNPVLDFSIPRGADAVNPFKGYYPSGVNMPDTGAVGDYLYAPPSDSQSTATATIWHYDSTQTPPWTDTEIDVSAVVGVEFGSRQAVTATKIKDENGEEVTGPADVLSAEAGKNLHDNFLALTEPVYGKNLCNPEELSALRQVIAVGTNSHIIGSEYTSSGSGTANYKCTGYIPVNGNNLYCNVGVGSDKIGWASYRLASQEEIEDSSVNKFIVDGSYYVCSNHSTSSIDVKKYSYTSGDVFVRFTIDTAAIPVGEGVQVEIGTQATAYEAYHEPQYAVNTSKIVDGSVTNQKLADNSVGVTKLDTTLVEIESSKNLVDWDNISKTSSQYYKMDTGAIGFGWSVGSRYEFIKVEPNTHYHLSQDGDNGVGSSTVGICFYSDGVQNAASSNIANYFLSGIAADTTQFTTPQNCAYIGISVFNDATKLMLNLGTSRGSYEEYGNSYSLNLPIKNNSVTLEKLDDGVQSLLNAPALEVPQDIYAVVGDTLQIFQYSIVKAVNPFSLKLDIVCSKGKKYDRYYEFTPSSGDVIANGYPITFNLYDNSRNLVATATSTLHVVNTNTNTPGSQKNVLIIGDSVYANGVIGCEIKRRLTTTTGTTGDTSNPKGIGWNNVSFVGRKSVSYDGNQVNQEAVGGYNWKIYSSDAYKYIRIYMSQADHDSIELDTRYTIQGVSQTNTYFLTVIEKGDNNDILFEPYGGYSYSETDIPSTGTLVKKGSGVGNSPIQYTSRVFEDGNPFWDSSLNDGQGGISFAKYSNDWNCGSITTLVIQLGINDFRSLSDVNNKFVYITNFLDAYKSYITANSISGKVFVCGLSLLDPRYPYAASSDYNYYQRRLVYYAYLEKLKELVSDSNYNFVKIVDSEAEFDAENGYATIQKPVNNRSSVTEQVGNNAQHPTDQARLMIADAIYRCVVGCGL